MEMDRNMSNNLNSCEEIGMSCLAVNTNQLSRYSDQEIDDGLRHILEKLNLEDRYPGKIKMSDILSLDIDKGSQSVSHSDIPRKLIQSIILSDSDCRDKIVADILKSVEKCKESCDSKDLFGDTDDDDMISPLDIFYAVIQCCDPLVQGFLYKKFYLCKIAVPFSFWQTHRQTKVTSLWPLRSVVIEHKGEEFSAIQLPTYTVAFARFARPTFSKSKLINHFLAGSAFEIFYNKDCPLGIEKRHLSTGCVELFWKQSHNDHITVFNLRGELSTHVEDAGMCIHSNVTDILTLIIDLKDIAMFREKKENIKKRFNRIILVVNNSHQSLREHQEIVKHIQQTENIEVMVTCGRKGIEISPSDLTETLERILSKCFESCNPNSLEGRLTDSLSSRDAVADRIAKMELIAREYITGFENPGHDTKKAQFIVASSKFSKAIADKKRESYKSNVDNVEKIREQIKTLCENQIDSVHPVITKLAHTLVKFESVADMQLFIAWVSELLEIKQRQILPQLIKANKEAFELLWTFQEENRTDVEIKAQRKIVETSSDAIDAVVISVTYLFREISHVYEACSQSNSPSKGIGLPKRDRILNVFADLIIRGHPFELLSGDSMYLPVAWVEHVFHKVHEKIGRANVFALSILGLQSSGKSTLLNTMFGAQFAVSAGRCTRGVHVQLLPINGKDLPFKYLLLIDTEGLRAPELGNENLNHDNALATFITGLGDATLLNIMGENMSEISDILQIMIHAFLRLKLANNRLDLNKSCMFIHHNVADVSASEKMHQGFQNILTTLDTMTQEAASSEGISDISRFNEVIEFNIKTNIWYFPNLWKGNPPFASINKRYSERARELRQNILEKALLTKTKSYKTLDDIVIQMNDLWQGVSRENFVFSFRNSLAVKAYCLLQKRLKSIMWKQEQELVNLFQQKANKVFSECSDISRLTSSYETVETSLIASHREKGFEARKMVLDLFEDNSYKEISAEWKDKTVLDFERHWVDLLNRCKDEILGLSKNREVEIKLGSLILDNEQKLYDESKNIANRLKTNKRNSASEIDSEFGKLWQEFIRHIPTDNKNSDVSKLFSDNLYHLLQKDTSILGDFIKKSDWPTCETTFDTLNDSLKYLCICDSDLSSTWNWKGIKGKIDMGSRVECIMPFIGHLYTSLNMEIQNKCSTDILISEHQVKEFLHNIEVWMTDIEKEKGKIGITLKSTCKVKIYLHASRFANMEFKKHNEVFERTFGKRLLEKKKEAHDRFCAMIDDRSVEERVIMSFSNTIGTSVKEYVRKAMKSRVISILSGSIIPLTKYNLLIDILTYLVQRGNFSDWNMYLRHPETYAKQYIEEKAKEHLFGEKYEYKREATMIVESTFSSIRTEIDESLEEVSQKKGDAHSWIEMFVNKTTLPLPIDKFNGVIMDLKGQKSLENIRDFKNQLISEIGKTEAEIKDGIACDKKVVWHGSNPYDEIFDRVWGCIEKCPFCRESCAREKTHDGLNHYCIQHRIDGCIGIHNADNGEISLNSCNYEVQSKCRYSCSMYKYACNDGKSKCSIKYHPFKDYKTHFPDWDIAPNPNMDDTSKIWMWFIAKFKDNLKTSVVKVQNIPERWNSFTAEEAINDYSKLMKTN